MTTTKELTLVFKNADGKHKNLVIAKPVENLDEATIKAAMQKIVNTHAFEKAGKKEYEGVVSASYVDRTVTKVYFCHGTIYIRCRYDSFVFFLTRFFKSMCIDDFLHCCFNRCFIQVFYWFCNHQVFMFSICVFKD